MDEVDEADEILEQVQDDFDEVVMVKMELLDEVLVLTDSEDEVVDEVLRSLVVHDLHDEAE